MKKTSKCKEYLLDATKKDTSLQSIVKEFDYDFRKFATREEIKNNATISLNKIVGTDHPSYHGVTWVSLFDKHLRRPGSLNSISNTENKICDTRYYTEDETYRNQFPQSKDWGVWIINNQDIYISTGNHRSTIAKFLASANLIPNEIIVPYVIHLTYDTNALDIYKKIEKNIEKIKKNNPHVEHILLSAKQNEIFNGENIRNFKIQYQFYISYKQINKHESKKFDNIYDLIDFMEESIDRNKPRVLHKKVLYSLKKLINTKRKATS